MATNVAWQQLRLQSMSPNDTIIARDYLGAEGYKQMVGSGIIGVSLNKLDDAKCLHAHTADFFLRGDNKIGANVIKTLQDKGISASGCDSCWQQCASNIDRKDASWWYMSVKNKEKLRTLRDKRRERRLLTGRT